MNEQYEDDDVVLTPVVIGLTRPPMMMGVPYNAFFLIIGVTILAFLVFDTFWTAIIAPIAYVLLFSICSYDIRILDILSVSTSKTPRIRNKNFWGTNTYNQ